MPKQCNSEHIAHVLCRPVVLAPMWTLSDILVSYNRVGTRPAPTRWQVTEGIVLREHDICYKELLVLCHHKVDGNEHVWDVELFRDQGNTARAGGHRGSV